MAGLFLVRDDDPAFAASALAGATAEFAHLPATPAQIALPGWRLLHFPYAQGGPAMLLERGESFAAAAGTLSFDGQMGTPALAALLDALDPLAPDWSRLGGQFVLAIRKHGRTFLLSDYFACLQLFHDAGDRLFSTSLLAAAHALPSLRFDPQGVYEFAFNVVPVGDDTVFADLKTLGPRIVLELTATGTLRHSLVKTLPATAGTRTAEERIAAAARALADVTATHVRQFGDAIHCPLSGGLDSRLLLAALRAAGASPQLYVYGGAQDEDVRIAQAIAAAEGLEIAHIDKTALAHVDPDGFPDQVRRNFHRFDALPTYGNIFDNGGHALAQDLRHAGGALAASGGAGEIFRNFFYLPDRPVTASAVASTFFARFAPSDATDAFDPRAFLANIRDKLLQALDLPAGAGPVPRLLLEQLYPRIRCRALFGREIGLESRLSPYFMPFLDQALVAEAMTLPIALKNAGRFEAMLLHVIDPALARHPSAYGHDFAGPPSRRHRFDEWSTRLRPPWLRRTSYAVQRRLRPMSDEHGGLLTPDYMSRVLDLDFPAMRRFFAMEAITDTGLWRRIACLEYLAQHLGSRLKH
jgi:hypothetical protein